VAWRVDATNTAATFTLPDATAAPADTEYTFLKVDGTANTLTVNCYAGQTIKSFSRLTASNGGNTVAVSRGVFTDATLYNKAPGDSISVTAVGSGWVTDDFGDDVL
jgi:hypothetical protein